MAMRISFRGEAEELFAEELASSREPLPTDREDRDQWRFRCVCALTKSGHVLGGAHMDMGPINFGPLCKEKLAYLEHVFVREEHRLQGIGTQVFQKLIQVAKAAGC
jgi:GNAT superfamily N-acetyltransferase